MQDKDWWSAPPDLTNLEGDYVFIELPDQNSSGQPGEYRFANLPQGIVWDAQNMVLKGRVAYRNASATQHEVVYQIEVETIPDAEVRTFSWTIRDNSRILLEDGMLVETWVGDEIDAVVPTTEVHDDVEWTFEADNLPPRLIIDEATGEITGIIVDPAIALDWPALYRDYSEFGYVEYPVVPRVRDSVSVDEVQLIWRVYLDCTCGNRGNRASTYKAEAPIPSIAVKAGNLIGNKYSSEQLHWDSVVGDQARALALATRFHNEDTVKAFQAAVGDAAKNVIKKILGLDEKWEQILKQFERIEKVKQVLELLTREDTLKYTYEYKQGDNNQLSVIFFYNRKTNEWYGLYGGTVSGLRPTDNPVEFSFLVRGTATPRFSTWTELPRRWLSPFPLPYTITIEDEIHWIKPR